MARESSSVEAWDASRVDAGAFVAVQWHSADSTVTGGVVIDMTHVDLADPDTWIDYYGARRVDGGRVIVWKTVDSTLHAGTQHLPTRYPVSGTVTATDWDSDRRCGGGLHFSHTPEMAAHYFTGDGEPRYLACQVAIADMVTLGDKIKAPACEVLYETDECGAPIHQEQ